jgi:Tol biopolymer transport system component
LISNDSVGWIFNPRYSPDLTKIAVYWNRPPTRGLWLISLSDGAQTLLIAAASTLPKPAAWSIDGKNILFRKDNDLYAQPIRGGKPYKYLTFPTPENSVIGDVSIDQKNKTIVYLVERSESDAWLMENFDPEVE